MPMTPLKLKLSDEELVRQYQAGKTTVQLARKCHCHPGTIRNRLLKQGVTLRFTGRKLGELTREELEHLVHVEKLSDGQIGARYGVSGSTIRLRRLHHGVVSHPCNGNRAPRTRNGRPTRSFEQQQEATRG